MVKTKKVAADKTATNWKTQTLRINKTDMYGVPKTLQRMKRWILSGLNKEPLSLDYQLIDPTNLKNGSTFNQAVKAMNPERCSGLGFMLSPPIVIVDVDHCINELGEFNEIANQLLMKLNTYVEYSQSQHGLHFIFIDNQIPVNFSGRKGIFEMYTSKHYFSITGNSIPTHPMDLVQLDGMTEKLLGEYFVVSEDTAIPQKLQHNPKFNKLFYQGDYNDYPSQSEGDLALLCMLAEYTHCDSEQMRQLFNQSQLAKRDKWNRVDYQNHQINQAIQTVQKQSQITVHLKWNPTELSSQQFFQEEWDKYTQQQIQSSQRSTGFDNLDQIQTFAPGIYGLGGTPGIGKTTFLNQLGEQLAFNGESVLYLSFEIPSEELYSKLLVRRVKLINPNTSLSAESIRQGKINPTVMNARQKLVNTDYVYNIVYVPSSIEIEDVIEFMKTWVTTHDTSTFILDYLQKIHTSRGYTTKDKIDYVMGQLQQFQTQYKTTLIISSSFNRSSYHSDVSMDSFKESGGIEYTAHVLWGLQYSIVEGKESGVNKGTHVKGISEQKLIIAKNQTPREVMLRCVKNRFGKDYVLHFQYYSEYDLFVPQKQDILQPTQIDGNCINWTKE